MDEIIDKIYSKLWKTLLSRFFLILFLVGSIVGAELKCYISIVMDSESGEQIELSLIDHENEGNKISKSEKEYTFYYVKNTKVAYCPELKNYK